MHRQLSASPVLSPTALLVCAALGVACAPRVPDRRPPVPVPRSFSAGGQAALPGRWWRAFGDAALAGLVRRALSGNPGLGAAWARLDQARAVARKAGAALFPELDANAGAIGTVSRDGRSATFTIGLAASYEVDLWGRVRSTRAAARSDVRASREDLRAQAISLSAEVANAWYRLVERRGQLRLIHAQVRLTSRVLTLVRFKFGQGQSRAADVLQQRQLLESLQGDLAQLQSERDVLRHQLAILAGAPPRGLEPPAGWQLPVLPALPRVGVPSALIKRRPDVRVALHKLRAADARVAAAVADRYPRLSLSAEGSLTGGWNPARFYTWLANLAGNLVAPLFDGGARRAEVDRTRAVASEALANYGQAVLTALQEVEDALAKERQQRRYLRSLDRQLRLSREVVAQTQLSYQNGEEEYLRVLDAQIKHQTLERTALSARRDLLLNRIALCRALAGGWTLSRPARPSARSAAPPARPAKRPARPGPARPATR